MRKMFLFFIGVFLSVFLGNIVVNSFIAQPLNTPLSAVYDFDEAKADSSSSTSPSATPVPSLTVDSIFTRPTFYTEPGDVVLYATGDIIPARVTDAKIRAKGAFYPFDKIADTLQMADIVIGNLEAPLVSTCPTHLEGMVFCGQPAFAQAMKKANVSVATLENNHIFNKGVQGREETIKYLEDAGVQVAIKNRPLVYKVKDLTFGIIAVNGVGARIDVDNIAKEIASIEELVDIVVVAPHWGKEYTYDPVKAVGIAPDDPRLIAHAIIDAGADLILGNHPHWVQGVEMYKDGFITYAHGNFIFDQEWSRETKEGVIGSYVFRDKKLVDVSFIPVIIEGYAQPRLADDMESQKILRLMRKSSERLI